MNQVFLRGWLGQDPEVRYTASGTAVANFSVCTGRKYKKKDGTDVDDTEWHRCVAFGRTGEIAGQYLHKGSSVLIRGSNRTNRWTTKDGEERKDRQVRVDELELIEPKKDAPADNRGASSRPPANTQPPPDEDIIPF